MPSTAIMGRELLAAGYRARTFEDERFTRWAIGDGVLIGKVRCTSWLSTEMAYRELKSGEYKRRLRETK
jgi:hypothetical protein